MPPPNHHEPAALLAEADWVRALAARLAFDGAQGSDLEQELWRAALEKPPAADVPLRPWLVGTATRMVAMARRSAVRRRQREQRVASSGDAPSTADLAQQVELQQRLLAAVHALPDAMRDVVLLRYYEDLPPRTIARRLGVPVATVRTRLQRAAERLRGSLDTEFGDRRRWMLLGVALARPRQVVAGAGIGATLLHCTIVLMSTKKFLVAAGALALLVAVPTTYLMMRGGPPVPPDYSRSTPVASLFDRSDASAKPPAGPVRRDAAPPAAAAGQLLGTVVDQHGTPIAGAIVRRHPKWIYDLRIENGEIARADVETTSADDGSFSLPPSLGGEVPLEAEHEQHVSRAERTAFRAGVPSTIVMLRTHEVPLEVTVVDRTTRAPVPRFLVDGVTWWRSDGATEGRFDRHLSVPNRGVGADGVFRGTARFVEGLPLELRIECRGHGRGEWDDGSDERPWRELRPEPGMLLHVVVEVDLGAAERLAARVQRGRVVDASDGQPIAGCGIAIHVDGQQGWTRSEQSRGDGSFAIAMPKSGDDGTVLVEHDDYQTQEIATQPDTELELRLVPRATFRCRVVDGNGRPLRGAPVLFRVWGHGVHEHLRTDDDGVFQVSRLLADRYHVFLLARDRDSDDHAIAHGSWTVGAGEHVDVVLQAEPPDVVRVIGTVTGVPPGMVPAFVPYAGEAGWVVGKQVGSGYDAGGLARGDYLVVLVPADDGRRDLPISLLPRVGIDGLGTVVVDLHAPAGRVRGRVVASTPLADGRVMLVPDVPATGPAAELFASDKFAQAMAVPLSPDGSFDVPRVADGRYRLELRGGSKVLASRELTVRGTADVGDWVLDG